MYQKPNYKNILFFCTISVLLSLVLITQRYPIYLDLTPMHPFQPSITTNQYFKHINGPVDISLFISKELSNEFPLTGFKRWLSSIHPNISIHQYDPYLSPERTDHYDIQNDGMIIIEYKDRRFDINMYEHLIMDQANYPESIQNNILKVLLQISQVTLPKTLLIHSNSNYLLSDTSQLGLQSLNYLFYQNLIDIDEISTVQDQIPQESYDLIILYKLSEMSESILNQLKETIHRSNRIIVFNHPKFSNFLNFLNLDTNISFQESIIEDDNYSLIHSKNQLLIQYESKYSQILTGVFPYSGPISLQYPTGNVTLTSEFSFITNNENTDKGPFNVIYNNLDNAIFINNYLIPTNYWITLGDNYKIIEDIIHTLMIDHPIISAKELDSKYIILSMNYILKLFLLIVILPLLLYPIILFFYKKLFLKK